MDRMLQYNSEEERSGQKPIAIKVADMFNDYNMTYEKRVCFIYGKTLEEMIGVLRLEMKVILRCMENMSHLLSDGVNAILTRIPHE